MAISKDLLHTLRPQIDAALQQVAAANGLQSLKAGSISYTADNFTMKVIGIVAGGLSREAQDYDALRLYTPSLPARGALFIWGRDQFAITGIRRSKVTAVKQSTGKAYTIRLDDLERKFSPMVLVV